MSAAALLLVGLAILVALFGRGEIAGFAVADAATFLVFAAAALAITSRTAERARGSWGAATTAMVLWLVAMTFLGAMYKHREMLTDAARSIADGTGLTEPQTEIGQGGEVTITRRGGGTFIVPARINDKAARFVFDTGASTIVLTHTTAEAIGLKPASLGYRVPVGTANGMAMAAPVTLDSVTIGAITLRRVGALVVRPGLLSENLLGQSFLERLASYEVRGNRLVFRAVRS
jgi:aspartyl protease family protein